ncbi:hypothetical protein [Pseudomonas farsensis]|uniref:Uncharacterized protein n=1 Tax=Pseudomonas farsensis TaxID=2745492 RepID=A0ABU8QWR9_9PSED
MNPQVGSDFDAFLAEEDLLEEVTALAVVARVIALQQAEAMKHLRWSGLDLSAEPSQ